MKECRGDQSIEISQRKQQSEREREIQHPTKSLLTQMYISQAYITQVYILHVYITQVSITHPLKNKKRTGRSLDHRSAYNTSFLLKGT